MSDNTNTNNDDGATYSVWVSATYSRPYDQKHGDYQTYEEARAVANEFNDNMSQMWEQGWMDPKDWCSAEVRKN